MENRRPRWPLFVVQVLGSLQVSIIAPARLWTDAIKAGRNDSDVGRNANYGLFPRGFQTIIRVRDKDKQKGMDLGKGAAAKG